jgi:folate-dependent tRNA-U54 methylase TrmFO/GidA
MKANFGILPPLEGRLKGKRTRGAAHAEHAHCDLETFLREHLAIQGEMA